MPILEETTKIYATWYSNHFSTLCKFSPLFQKIIRTLKLYQQRLIALQLHTANPPLVPYLGLYLTDLTFIEDGAQDYTDGGLVNFDKRRLLASVIKEIQQYQQVPYCLSEVPVIKEYLHHVEGICKLILSDLLSRNG